MSPSQTQEATMTKLTDQEAYELRQRERDEVARDEMNRKLESARLIRDAYDNRDPKAQDEIFLAAVRAAKQIVQFADWSEALTYCQVQQVFGLCLGSSSNIKNSYAYQDKLRADWQAIPNIADEINENRRQRIITLAERNREQIAYWEWMHEVNLEAYRQVVAEIKSNDGSENQYFARVPSEWQDPKQPKTNMAARPTALQAQGDALFGKK